MFSLCLADLSLNWVMRLSSPNIVYLGNYLGAIKNWADRAEEFDCYYFMADMHTITVLRKKLTAPPST